MPSHIDTVQTYWRAWEAGRPHAAAEVVTHDLVVRAAIGEWQPVAGIRGVERMLQELAERGVRITPTAEAWAELGDYVVVRGTSAVTRDDAREDIPMWWVFHLREDRIAALTTKLSREEALQHVEWDRR